MTFRRVDIQVYGVSSRASELERFLRGFPCVFYASVDPATETAYIEYDDQPTDLEEILEGAAQRGFRMGRPLVFVA